MADTQTDKKEHERKHECCGSENQKGINPPDNPHCLCNCHYDEFAQALAQSSSSSPISQQLQECYDNDSLDKVTIIHKDYLLKIIQQVKELENDRISLQQKLSEQMNEKWKQRNKMLDYFEKYHKLLELKLKSDTENSIKLEEFKKEIQTRIGYYKIKEDGEKIAELYVVLELADKYFGGKG